MIIHYRSQKSKGFLPRTQCIPHSGILRCAALLVHYCVCGLRIYSLLSPHSKLRVCHSGDVCSNCSAIYLWLITSPRLAIFLQNAVALKLEKQKGLTKVRPWCTSRDCGSTTAPKNPKDFYPGPTAYRIAVYCQARRCYFP